MRRTRSAAVLVAAVLAACGGNNGGPSKSDYIGKADAICSSADRKIDAAFYGAKDRRNPAPKDAQTILKTVLPVERKLVSDLRALDKPDGDEDELGRIYDDWDAATKRLEAASRDSKASAAFIELSGEGDMVYSKATRAVGAYGMVNCEASLPTLSGQAR